MGGCTRAELRKLCLMIFWWASNPKNVKSEQTPNEKHLTPKCTLDDLRKTLLLLRVSSLSSVLILFQKKNIKISYHFVLSHVKEDRHPSRTFCSWIWALTTRYSADGGFWLVTSSSVSLSQLSRGSRASWNFPQCNRASCSWAIRSATWGRERWLWVE